MHHVILLSCEDNEAEPHQSTESQPPKKTKGPLTILFDDVTLTTSSKITNEEKVETKLLRYNHEVMLSYESEPLEW